MKLMHYVAKNLLLGDDTKKLLTKIFGHRWRIPFVSFRATIGPAVGAVRNETVVLGGCHQFETIRSYYDVVGPKGSIIAIEANKENVENLRNAIKNDRELSNANNVTVVEKGIWDKKGTATFIANAGDYPGLDKIKSEKLRDFSYAKVDKAKEIEIEVDSLDNILKDLGVKEVDYVVLTINDAELLALDGIEQLLRDNPQVRFSMNSEDPRPCQQVKKELIDKGFRIYSVPTKNSASLRIIYAFRPEA